MQSLTNSWRWRTRECVLLGGFCCELTSEERNRWHLIANGTAALMAYHLAYEAWDSMPSEATYKAWADAEVTLYVMGKNFFAVAVAERERVDAEAKAGFDRDEARRVATDEPFAPPGE